MHGAFCDQPWPGNDARDDPGLSRRVGGGDTRRTGLIPCACPMFCFVGLLSAIRELNFSVFFPGRTKFSKTRHKMLQIVKFSRNREIFAKTRKKKTVDNEAREARSAKPFFILVFQEKSLCIADHARRVRCLFYFLCKCVFLWAYNSIW